MRSPARLFASRVFFFAGFAAAVGCGAVASTGSDGGTGSTGGGSANDGATSSSADGAVTTFDAAPVGDATLPTLPDGGAFCSGSTPRLFINGADAQVFKTSGKALALNCCDSAELDVATSMFQAVLYVMWRSPAATGSGGSIDLGSAPMGFGIELDLGCDPATTSCANVGEERYTDGFQGTITYAASASGVTTSYCLSVAENPASPHTVIHSLQLYAPNVASTF